MYVNLCKLFVSVFMLYSTWYSQIWGANQVILYSSVALSIIFMLIDAAFVLKRLEIGRMNPVVKMYVFFGLYVTVAGLFVSVDKAAFVSSVFTYTAFTIIAFEIWYISFRLKNFNWILNLIYVLSLLCALTTIFIGQDYKTEVIVTTMSKFNNPNTLGVLMVFGIFAAIFQKEAFNRNFLLRYASIFMFIYVILLSGSRKALFAGVGLFAFWIIAYFNENKKEKLTSKTLFIVCTIIFSIVGASIYMINVYVGMSGFERLLLLFTEDGTSGRLQLMDMAVQYWKTSPILGIGLDQFRILNPYGYYSHSTYSEILSCTGVLGCFLFFIPLAKLLYIAIRKSMGKRDNMYEIRICLLMLGVELFLGVGQIFIYSATHMILLVFIANTIYEEIDCQILKEKSVKIVV